jgi:hypothetical protein
MRQTLLCFKTYYKLGDGGHVFPPLAKNVVLQVRIQHYVGTCPPRYLLFVGLIKEAKENIV